MEDVFLAPRVGIEPTTVGLERHCSIQLSYRGKVKVLRSPPKLHVSGAKGERAGS